MIALALALPLTPAALAATSATSSAAKPTSAKKKATKKKATKKPRRVVAMPTLPVSTPGLETIVQDDGLLLFRPRAEAEAAVARMKEMGVDRVRVTASWSSLTRDPESDTKPAGFDARDPAAYEQARWTHLDNAVRAIRAAGLGAIIDIGFWAPHWATDDPPGPRARSNIDPIAYGDFATAVALRYSGTFSRPADPPKAAPAPEPEPEPTEDASLIGGLIGPLVPFPVTEPTRRRSRRRPRRRARPRAQRAAAAASTSSSSGTSPTTRPC